MVVQDASCFEGDTEPEDKLDGDGGVGDVLLCGCQGVLPGGDRVTGTTFFTTTQTAKIVHMSILLTTI